MSAAAPEPSLALQCYKHNHHCDALHQAGSGYSILSPLKAWLAWLAVSVWDIGDSIAGVLGNFVWIAGSKSGNA